MRTRERPPQGGCFFARRTAAGVILPGRSPRVFPVALPWKICYTVTVCIDPGYATIGFGLITAERAQVNMLTYGAITTPAGLPLSRRLYQIGTDMEDLIGQLKPDVISIEELFCNTNLTTGIAVAHARGVLLYTAEKCGIPLHEYTPSQVKMAVVGYGKAEKRQVMDMTRRLLHLKAVPRPDDAADALALALCHARSATSRLPLQDSRVKETI